MDEKKNEKINGAKQFTNEEVLKKIYGKIRLSKTITSQLQAECL